MNIVKIKGTGIGPSVYTCNKGWLSNVKNSEEYEYCRINFDGTVNYYTGKIYAEKERLAISNFNPENPQQFIPVSYINHDGEMSPSREGCINPFQKEENYEALIPKSDSLLFRYFECKQGEIPIIFGNKTQNKNTLLCIPGLFRDNIKFNDSIYVNFSFDKQTALIYQIGNNQVLIIDNPVFV